MNEIQIGMSESEVLSRLGEPREINRTVTQYTTSEQWVYYDVLYLYFEDGLLNTIQE